MAGGLFQLACDIGKGAQQLAADIVSTFAVQHFAQFVLVLLQMLIAEFASQGAQFSANVPGAVVFNIIIDILDHSGSHTIISVRIGYQIVHRLLNEQGLVEVHLVMGGLAELMGQAGQQPLEEGVDGLHAEVVVVVEDFGQGAGRALLEGGIVEWLRQSFADGCHEFRIVVHAIHLGHGLKVVQDALLHFLGGFVGEGHGQDAAVHVVLAAKEERDIFGRNGEGFARTGRGIIDSKIRHRRERLVCNACKGKKNPFVAQWQDERNMKNLIWSRLTFGYVGYIK